MNYPADTLSSQFIIPPYMLADDYELGLRGLNRTPLHLRSYEETTTDVRRQLHGDVALAVLGRYDNRAGGDDFLRNYTRTIGESLLTEAKYRFPSDLEEFLTDAMTFEYTSILRAYNEALKNEDELDEDRIATLPELWVTNVMSAHKGDISSAIDELTVLLYEETARELSSYIGERWRRNGSKLLQLVSTSQ